ncbi:10412_t:CDS:1 [Funneliformis geosporum]|uniref:ADP-ribose 1''-phosphate phosphatase n=1 Tax=Funneliformis geosporum TaxID=1117311 RepID=A0A9W4WSN2_9GLOM|nr:5449_t:CDS:1 [Funneliformis geosporum]CAI2176446.1 10412_t:CDS:1 [Funneliformis geosporum]
MSSNSQPSQITYDTKFIFEETRGDLFNDAPENSSLAHCVSADFKMSKGIAKIFKKKFSTRGLFDQNKKVGQVATLYRNNRYIFYIITKQIFSDKPTREDFVLALKDLRRACEDKNVKLLCLPRIGTGLDKLPLEFVHRTIINVFDGYEMKMIMYYL